MARHDQQPKPSAYVCTACHEIECNKCVDSVRFTLFGPGIVRVCICQHEDWKAVHEGEAW